MQQNQSNTPYRRRRRMDRYAGAPEMPQELPIADDLPLPEADVEALGLADAAPEEPAHDKRMDTVHRWPVVEDRPDAQPSPEQERRSWQQSQPDAWRDPVGTQFYGDDDQPEEPEVQRPYQQLTADRTVCLAAVMAAMISPFAIFLLFVERRDRALRHYAVQSAALTGLHIAALVLAAVISWLTGAIPVLGFVLRLSSLLVYFGSLTALLVLRLRLMSFAWHGCRWDVPLLGRWLQRFVTQ